MDFVDGVGRVLVRWDVGLWGGAWIGVDVRRCEKCTWVAHGRANLCVFLNLNPRV